METDDQEVPSVHTGAEATSLRWWHVVSGLVGWLTAAFLVVWFIAHASAESVHASAAITGMAAFVAMVAIIVAVQVLRPALIRTRMVPQAIPPPSRDVDPLGRPLRDPAHWPGLRGELVMTTDDLGRRGPVELGGDR